MRSMRGISLISLAAAILFSGAAAATKVAPIDDLGALGPAPFSHVGSANAPQRAAPQVTLALGLDLASAGNWLAGQQKPGGAFPWTPNDASVFTNTQGATSLGLLRAYEVKGTPALLAGAVANGDCQITDCIAGWTYGDGHHRFATHDPLFLIELSRVSGNPVYADFVTAQFWDRLESSSYGPSVNLDASAFAASILASRSGQGFPELAAWDISKLVVAAHLAGKPLIAQAFMAVVLQSLNASDATHTAFDISGLAGAVWASARSGIALDPTSGKWASANSTAQLAAVLAGYQFSGDGGFVGSSADALSSANTGAQITAFGMLALNATSRASYNAALLSASSYLGSVQQGSGEILAYAGASPTASGAVESHAESMEAFADSIAAVERWVSASGGVDGGDCSIQASPCATIAYAISQSYENNTIHIASGTYVDALTIGIDGLRLIGSDPSNKPQLTRISGATNQPLLVIRNAATGSVRNVRIENLEFRMDQSFVGEGILATGFVNGLHIVGNHFVASQSGPAIGTFGFRNAISINDVRNSLGFGRGDGSDVTIDSNVIDGAAAALLRSGIDMDGGVGTITHNTVTAGTHDITVRFIGTTAQSTSSTLSIDHNDLRGRGLEMDSPSATAGAITISDNSLHAIAGINGSSPYPADFSLMRLVDNYVPKPVTLARNTFSGHQGNYRGLLLWNFPALTAVDNVFTPASGAGDFVSLVISNKELNSVNPPQPPYPMSITALRNTFNGSGVAGAGRAVELLDDNDANGSAPFGALTFGDSTPGNQNLFDGNLRWYFHLDDYTCNTSTAPQCTFLDYAGAIGSSAALSTQVRPFRANLSAINNLYAGAAPSQATIADLRARTYDRNANAVLGLVDYGFEPTHAIVYVDDAFAGHTYGDTLPFSHSFAGIGAQPAHYGIDAYATIPDGLMHADTGGLVYVAKGSYSDAVTIAREVQLIGDGNADTNPAQSTVQHAGVTIDAGGSSAASPLLLQNLRVDGTTAVGITLNGSHSFITLDKLVSNGNVGDGFHAFGTATTQYLRVSDSHFDNNGRFPPTFQGDLVAGFNFGENASASHVTISNSSFNGNNGAGLVVNNIGSQSSLTTITDWTITGSEFSRNIPVDAPADPNFYTGGGGIWLKTSVAGSAIDGFSVSTSTFADNGTGQTNHFGFGDRKLNANGISIRARAGTTMHDVHVCANTFAETATPGIQLAGILVLDETANTGYQPVEVCSSNSFSGLAHSVSGYEQYFSSNGKPWNGSQPTVNITGGGISGTEYINGYVVRVRDGVRFPNIASAMADAGTIAGDEIHAPAGVYHENVTVSHDGMTLSGDGAGTVIDGTTLGGSGITLPNGRVNVTVRDLTVQNFAAIGNGACIYGALSNNGTTISRTTVNHCLGGRGGIYLSGGNAIDNVSLDHNDVSDTDGRGIVIWDGVKTHISITDNHVHDQSGCCGIELQDGAASGVTVTGNTVENVGDSGMAFVQLGGAFANRIAGNTLTNTGRFGIEIKIPDGSGTDSGAGSIVVENNVITGSVTATNPRDRAGIAVMRRSYSAAYPFETDATRGVVLRDNIISGFKTTNTAQYEGYGILVEGLGSVVNHNTLSNNDVGLQIQQANPNGTPPGDANQDSISDWFGRGNAPLTCVNVGAGAQANAISASTLSNQRSVPSTAAMIGARVLNQNTGVRYCSINTAVAAATAGDVIVAEAGVYAEDVVIAKAVTVRGAKAGVNAGVGATRDGLSGESILVPAAAETDFSASSYTKSVVKIQSDDVVLDGFVIDTDNPGIVSGVDLNGANPDVAGGVFASGNRLHLTNLIVRNAVYACIDGGYYTTAAQDGSTIDNNLVTNCDGPSYGIGIALDSNFYAQVSGNRLLGVRTGVQLDNTYQATPTSGYAPSVSGNQIAAKRGGIWANLFYQNASTYRIANNIITATAGTGQWNGVWIESMQSAQTIDIASNAIDGSGATGRTRVGYLLNNIVSSAAATTAIDGGAVTNVDIGVLATDATRYTGPVNDFGVRNVAFSNVALGAFYVEDTTQTPGSSKLSIGTGNTYTDVAHQLVLSGTAPQVSGAVDEAFVRSARPFVLNALVSTIGNPTCSTEICQTASAPIDSGIGAVNAHGTVNVEDGAFAQTVSIDKAVQLRGPKHGVAGSDGTRGSGEAILSPPTGIALRVLASDVSVDGFTVQNVNDTAIASGANYGAVTSQVQIINNRVLDVHAGSALYTNGPRNTPVTQWTVANNFIDGVTAATGSGINLWAAANSAITDNVVRHIAFGGIQLNGDATVQVLRNSVGDTAHNGINIAQSSGVTVSGNAIVNANTGGTADEAGLTLYGGTSDTRFVCNSVSGSGLNSFSTASAINEPLSNVRIYDNALLIPSGASHNLTQAIVIGSNWYGGAAPSVGGTNAAAAQVASALPASPIGNPSCGNNIATAIQIVGGSPQSAAINATFAQKLTARVVDESGGAVIGAVLNFQVPASGAGATLSSTSGFTDYDGRVAVTATANAFAGSYVVAANDGPISSSGFALTNTNTLGVALDLNGPIANVLQDVPTAYSGRLNNTGAALTENVLVHVALTSTRSGGIQAGDVTGQYDIGFGWQPLPLALVGGELVVEYGAPGFAMPANYDVTTQFRFSFHYAAAAGTTYSSNASVRGTSSGTVYASDTLGTQVVASTTRVNLSLAGAGSTGVNQPTAYSARLTNTGSPTPENVRVGFVIGRGEGIESSDVTVEYDLGGGNFQPIPLSACGVQRCASFGPPAGFAVPNGYDATTPLRVTYHRSGTYSVNATVDGVALPTTTYASAALTVTAGATAQLDLDGPSQGVQIGGAAIYTVRLANPSGDALAQAASFRLEITEQPGLIDAADLFGVEFDDGSGYVNVTAQPTAGSNGGLVYVFDHAGAGYAVAGDSTFVGHLRLRYAKATTFPLRLGASGVGTPPENYGSDRVDTKVIAPQGGIVFDVTGPVSGVEVGNDTLFVGHLRNDSGDALPEPVHTHFCISRDGAPATSADLIGTISFSGSGGPFTGALTLDAGGCATLGDETFSADYDQVGEFVLNYATPGSYVMSGELTGAQSGTVYAAANQSTLVTQPSGGRSVSLDGALDAVVGADTAYLGTYHNGGSAIPGTQEWRVCVAKDGNPAGSGDVAIAYDLDGSASYASAATLDGNGCATLATFHSNAGESRSAELRYTYRHVGTFVSTTVVRSVSNPLSVYASDNATTQVGKGTASVLLSDLSAHYDGTAHHATVTTTPSGLSVSVHYSGPASVTCDSADSHCGPSAAGSYAVVATVNDVDWLGSATASYVIDDASAITLSLSGPARAIAAQPNGPWSTGFVGTVSNSGGPTSQAVHYVMSVVRIDDNNADPIALSDVDACVQIGDGYQGACDSGYFSLEAGKTAGSRDGRAAVRFRYPNLPANDLPLPTLSALPVPFSFRFAAGEYRLVIDVVGSDGTLFASSSSLVTTVPAVQVSLNGSFTGAAEQSLLSTTTLSNHGGRVPENAIVRLTLSGSGLSPSDVEFAYQVGSSYFTLPWTVSGDDLVAYFGPQPGGFPIPDGYNQTTAGRGIFHRTGSFHLAVDVVDAATHSEIFATDENDFSIGAQSVAITLSDLTQVYDGSPRAVSVNAVPNGAPVTLSYQGSGSTSYGPSASPPVNAGSYAISASATGNYSGNASGTLTVLKANASLTLAALSATYDGAAHCATTVSVPVALSTSLRYDGQAACPVDAGDYVVTASITDPNYVGSASDVLHIARAGGATIALNDDDGTADATIHRAYNAAPQAVSATTTPSGIAYAVTYTGTAGTSYATSSSPPSALGSYTVQATITSPNYDVASATATLRIDNAAAPVLTVNAPGSGNVDAVIATAVQLQNTTAPLGENVLVRYTVTRGGDDLSTADLGISYFDGSGYQSLGLTDAGAALVGYFGPQPGGFALPVGYDATTPGQAIFHATGSYTITLDLVGVHAPATVYATRSVSIAIDAASNAIAIDPASLNAVYNGGAHPAVVSTTPSGLSYAVTYAGSGSTVYASSAVPPTNAGSYLVTATITQAGHSGSTSGVLVIAKATASVSLGNLTQTYDGSAKPVSVSTTSSLASSVTYDGSTTAPSGVGHYSVIATVTDANYAGSATATLNIVDGSIIGIAIGGPASITADTLSGMLFTADTQNSGSGPTPTKVYFRITAARVSGPASTPVALSDVEVCVQDTNGIGGAPCAVPNVHLDQKSLVTDTDGRPAVRLRYPQVAANEIVLPVGALPTLREQLQLKAGDWRLRVDVMASDDSRVYASSVLNVSAVADGAAAITAQNGPFSGVAGVALATLPQVKVSDSHGNPVGGANVTFQNVTGGGSIGGTAVVTDVNGLARLGSWMLGSVPGDNTVDACIVVGATPQCVTFHATGTPQSGLSIGITDQKHYVQFGKLVTYVVSVSNGGPSSTNPVTVSGLLPPQFDAASASWSCLAHLNGATCGSGASGRLNDTAASLPAGSSLTYVITATVKADVAPDVELITHTVTASDAGGSVSATDTTQIVIFHDDLEGTSGTNAALPIGVLKSGGTLSLGRADTRLVGDGLSTLASGASAKGESFRVEALRVGAQIWLRLVHGNASGEMAGEWSALVGSPSLALRLARDDQGAWQVVLDLGNTTLSIGLGQGDDSGIAVYGPGGA